MTWGGVAIGAGSIIGGVVGAQGAKNAVPKAPKWLTQAQQGNVYNAQQIAQTPQQYYPGETFVRSLPSEGNAFGQQNQYNNSMFGNPYLPGGGGQSTSPFGNTLGAMNSQLTGNNPGGQASQQIMPFATGQIGQAFQGPSQINPNQYMPTFGQAGGLDARGAIGQMMSGQPQWNQASTVANAGSSPFSSGGFGGGIGGANSLLGQFGQAGNLDATQAYQKNLSGQGDYSTLQSNIEAANAPILRQLNQEIIPGLNSRATFLNNGTGGIKTLNKVLPDVMDRMNQNATGLYEGERQRALQAQQTAMGQVGQAGLQQGGQASSQMYGAQNQIAGQNYGAFGNAMNQANQDRSNAAGLVSSGGLSAYGLGLQGAGLNANQQNQYRSDTLGLGNLGAGLSSDQSTNQARMAALFPSIYQAGRQPSTDAAGYAQYDRGLAEQQLGDQMSRYNFNQQDPMNRASWLAGILGQTNAQPTGGSGQASSILGGAIAGGQLGQIFGNSFGLGQPTNGTMNSQGVGLSNQMLQQAYGQLNGLNLFGSGG